MRRLKMMECLKVLIGSEITVVVPPTSAKEGSPKAAREPRKRILSDFRRVIMSSAPDCLSSHDERQLFIASEMRQRTIHQSGQQHVEFNTRVVNYPERAYLELLNPLDHDIFRMLGNGNAGLNLEVLGHGTTTRVLLKLADLPYVQIYQKRCHDAPYLDMSFNFHKRISQAGLAHKLSVSLYESRGDAASTVQVLLSYYKYMAKSSPPGHGKIVTQPQDNEAAMRLRVETELKAW